MSTIADLQSFINAAGSGRVALATDEQGNVTGFKAASLGHRLKSFFNIGNARAENARLIDHVKNLLRNSENFYGVRDRIDQLFEGVNAKRAIRSADLRAIFANIGTSTQENPVALYEVTTARAAMMGIPEFLQGDEDGHMARTYSYVAADIASAHGRSGGLDALDVSAEVQDLKTRAEELSGMCAGNGRALESLKKNFRTFFIDGGANVRAADASRGIMRGLLDCDAAVERLYAGENEVVKTAAKQIFYGAAKPCDEAALAAPLAQAAAVRTELLAGMPDDARAIFAQLKDFGAHFAGVRIQMPAGAGRDPDLQTHVTFTILTKALADMPRAELENLFEKLSGQTGTNVINFLADHAGDSEEASKRFGIAHEVLKIAGKLLGRDVPEARGGADLAKLPVEFVRDLGVEEAVCGEGAESIRAMLTSPSKPDARGRLQPCAADLSPAQYRARMDRSSEAMSRINLFGEMVKLVENDVGNSCCVFAKDIHRGMDVVVDGGEALPHDFEAAKDALARFVTGNGGARYAELEPGAKTKTRILMALLSQETEKIVCEGFVLALQSPVILAEKDDSKALESVRRFSLRHTEDGGFAITYEMKRHGSVLIPPAGRNLFVKPESVHEGVVEIKVSGAEFERLAAADWEHPGFSIRDFLSENKRMPDLVYACGDAIPEAFRLNGEFSACARVNLAGLK